MNRRELESIAATIEAARLRASRDKTSARAVRLFEIYTIAEGIADTFGIDKPRFLRTCGFSTKAILPKLIAIGVAEDTTPPVPE